MGGGGRTDKLGRFSTNVYQGDNFFMTFCLLSSTPRPGVGGGGGGGGGCILKGNNLLQRISEAANKLTTIHSGSTVNTHNS